MKALPNFGAIPVCDFHLNYNNTFVFLFLLTHQKAIRHKEEVILCCGCVRPDRYDVSYELPYRGYVPGETMFPDIRIRNFTRNPIHVYVRLQMVSKVCVHACVSVWVWVCVCVCVCVSLSVCVCLFVCA